MDNSWSIPVRMVLLLLLVAAVIWLMVLIAPLLQTLVVAALLAYLLQPLVTWLRTHTALERQGASAIVFAGVLLLFFSVPILLGTAAVNQLNRLGADLLAAGEEIQGWLAQPISIWGFTVVPQDALSGIETFATDTLSSLPSGSLTAITSLTTNLLWALVIVVMLFYFLRDGHIIKTWLVALLPVSYQVEISRLVDEVDEVWGRFLRIQILLFVLLTLLMIGGTGLIVGLFRIGLLRWSPLGFILLLALFYTGLQQVDNFWLRPRMLGRHLKLHPAVVFLSLIAGLIISGVLGALLAVPLVATVRVVAKYLHRKWLGLPPWPAQPALEEDESTEVTVLTA